VELYTFGFAGNKSLMKVTDENLVERVKQVVCLSVSIRLQIQFVSHIKWRRLH